jgi:glycoprotein endo-alpha-1,2-mannosidase
MRKALMKRGHKYLLSQLLFFLFALSGSDVFSQKAVHFQSPGDFVEVLPAASLAPSQFTIEFWLRVYDIGDPEVASGEQTIIDKRDGQNGYNIRLAGSSFPLPIFAFVEPGAVSAGDAISRNLWSHIAITQHADSLKIYVDATLMEANSNVYASNTNSPLRIGEFLGYPGAYLGLRGDIDELRIWNEVRNQSEIEALMYAKLNGTEPGLAAYWDFDSQIDGTVLDVSPNGNDGILMGEAILIDSDAPVGFIPPPPPVGLRAYGKNQSIELAWMPAGDNIKNYQLFRADSVDFPAEINNLLATISGLDTIYTDNNITPDKNYYYRLRTIDQEDHASQPGRTALSRTPTLENGYITGVYYYPWYGPSQGGHDWIGQYVRDDLVPKQPPLLGHYSSRDTLVIRQHLEWMKNYGIDFIVSSWWGQHSWEDIALRDFILAEIANTPIKFTIYYESALLSIEQGEIDIDAAKEEQLVDDFNYIAETYFAHPNFLRIEDKLVVFIYLSRLYSGNYQQAFSRIRNEMQMNGYEVFLVGDEVGWGESSAPHMQFLDAVSPYIMLGKDIHQGYPLEKDFFADISVQAGEWEEVSHSQEKFVIPCVNPGFNNRSVGGEGSVRPRQNRAGAQSTSTLEEYIKVMQSFVDPQLKIIMITSWNEWHEDTQIEPTILTEPTNTDISDSGNFYTQGFSYEGYGYKPLEVVRSLLASELPVQVDKNSLTIPKRFILHQNYPNPFNNSTMISYQLPKTSQVNLTIYNILGQRVVTLVSESQKPGNYTVEWDASQSAYPAPRRTEMASGVYLYRLSVGFLATESGRSLAGESEDLSQATQVFVETRKMVLMR